MYACSIHEFKNLAWHNRLVMIEACTDNAICLLFQEFDRWGFMSTWVCVCVSVFWLIEYYPNNVCSHSVSHHVNMKVIVAMAIERLLHRPNIGQRAQ